MNYNEEELSQLGLCSYGRNVKIHKTVILINPEFISIGANTRIDAFSIISAGKDGIYIGDNIHIAAGCYIFGGGGKVIMEDFSAISARTSIYTATDDYVEGYLSNPTIPDKYKKVQCGDVTLRKHVLIGSSSMIMPGVEMGFGSVAGAFTYIDKSVDEYYLVVGKPMKIIKKVRAPLVDMEKAFRDDQS